MEKRLTKGRLKGLILIVINVLLLMFSTNIYSKSTESKDILLTGFVTDANGEPLIGVSVKVKGNAMGTITDAKGKFQINISDPSTVLVVSYVGYGTQEIQAGNKSPLNIKLTDDLKVIDEVVVTGYGAQKKSQTTGASGGIDNKVITSQPTTTVERTLQGRIAGVDVSEDAGGSVSVRVRGGSSFNSGNEPLYVIDGVIISPDLDISNSDVSTNPLNGINPNDIENIEVLKDAAATAVYGSRGANGVVIVTTKRGRAGDAKINFSSYVGWQTVGNMVKMAKKDEYINYYNTLVNKLNVPGLNDYFPTISPELASKLPDSDWQKAVYQSTPIMNYQISAQGGTDKLTYFVSGNYYKQGSPAPGAEIERYAARINLDAVLKPKIKLTNSLNFSKVNTGRILNGGNISLYVPIVPIYDENGSYSKDAFYYFRDDYGLKKQSNLVNPFRALESARNSLSTIDIQWNIALTYTIKPNLTLKSNLALDALTSSNESKTPNFTTNDPKDIIYRNALASGVSYTNENLLTWVKKIGTKHTFTNSALLSYQSQVNLNRVTGNQTNLNNTNTESVYYPAAAANNSIIIVPTYTKIASAMARVNYSYMGRYNLGITSRYDGNSNLGTNKWAMFPSVAFSWNVYQEKFMSQIHKVSDLKIRASYGVTGNATFSQYQAIYRSQITQVPFGNLGNTTNAYILGNIPLPDLTWERVSQANVGFDLGFFRNKISFSVDVYDKMNNNAVLYTLAPPSSGFTYTMDNSGTLQTRGLDFSFKTINLDKKIKWNTSGNISVVRTYVRDLGGPEYAAPIVNGQFQVVNGVAVSNNIYTVYNINRPVGEFYGLIQDGVWQTTAQIQKEGTMPDAIPGQRRFRDLDGNGKIENLDGKDKTYLGHFYPDFTYGFTNNVSYKKWTLNVFFQGSQGNSAVNFQRIQQTANLTNYDNIGEGVYSQAWNSLNPNPNAQISQIGVGDPNALRYFSNQWVEDASYLQLKNVAVTYGLPLNKLIKGVTSSNISLSAQNLLVITKFSGVSPLNVNQNTGSINNVMPQTRTYTLTFNFGF